MIIMCEVLEHLNFNPLPLLKEINRIGAPGSIFYVSMPNATSIYHRLAVVTGHAGGVQVSEFFEQLGRVTRTRFIVETESGDAAVSWTMLAGPSNAVCEKSALAAESMPPLAWSIEAETAKDPRSRNCSPKLKGTVNAMCSKGRSGSLPGLA